MEVLAKGEFTLSAGASVAINVIIPPLDGEHPQFAGSRRARRESCFRRLPAGRLTVTLGSDKAPRQSSIVDVQSNCLAIIW